jgi:hypothetical protein
MFDKIKAGFQRFAMKALNIENNGLYHWNTFDGYSQTQNRMLEVLSGCSERLDNSMNPRDWVELSDIMYIKIPFVQTAIGKSAEYVGRMCIEINLPENEATKAIIKAAEDFIQTCPLLKEQPNTPKLKTGLDVLSVEIIESCQRVGMSFLEERFDDKGNFIGVLKYNPRHFYYQKTDGQNAELWYNQQKVDTESPFFQYLALRYEDGYDWGRPIVYGAELAGTSWLRTYNAAVNSSVRRADPATLTMITNNDAKAFETTKNDKGESVLTQTAQMWANIMSSIKNAVLRGLKDMSNGKASHTVVSAPGKDLTVTSQTYGDGITGGIDGETLTFLSVVLANALHISVEEFSLLVKGGGGFSGERFKMLMQSNGNWITSTRNDISPIQLNLIKNHLRRLNFNPKLIDSLFIEWKYSDYETDIEKATLAKTQAETAEKIMNVVEKIAMINPAAAYQYAAENGIIIE